MEEELDEDEGILNTSPGDEPGILFCPVTGYTRDLRRGYKLKSSEEEMDEDERETSYSDLVQDGQRVVHVCATVIDKSNRGRHPCAGGLLSGSGQQDNSGMLRLRATIIEVDMLCLTGVI